MSQKHKNTGKKKDLEQKVEVHLQYQIISSVTTNSQPLYSHLYYFWKPYWKLWVYVARPNFHQQFIQPLTVLQWGYWLYKEFQKIFFNKNENSIINLELHIIKKEWKSKKKYWGFQYDLIPLLIQLFHVYSMLILPVL